MSEKLTKMVPKWSEHLSRIDPGGALEATREPPLKQGASKTSFLMIWAPCWDPLWNQFGLILGHHFYDVFWKCLFYGLGLHLGPKTPQKCVFLAYREVTLKYSLLCPYVNVFCVFLELKSWISFLGMCFCFSCHFCKSSPKRGLVKFSIYIYIYIYYVYTYT